MTEYELRTPGGVWTANEPEAELAELLERWGTGGATVVFRSSAGREVEWRARVDEPPPPRVALEVRWSWRGYTHHTRLTSTMDGVWEEMVNRCMVPEGARFSSVEEAE